MKKQTPSRGAKARAKRKLRTRLIALGALACALLLLCGMSMGWFAREDTLDIPKTQTDDDGVLRVYLKSLGAPVALGLTVDGVYSVDGDAGFRFARGSNLSVAQDGGSLYLSCGGLTIDMGESFTLKRHQSESEGAPNGLYIHESEKDALFAGDLRMSADGEAIRCVLSIQAEDYLYGVVAYEMSDSFPLEALKAQAVAARTYAVRAKKYAGSKDYDVVDTTADQVYKGYDPRYVNVIKAVDETRGIVGMYKGDYAGCFYTASNGGQVASTYQIWGRNGDYDYIQMKDDPYDLENEQSVVKRAYIDADPAKNPELYQLLASSVTEALSQMGYSDELEDIKIERISAITPADPDTEGSYMYGAMDFRLSLSARKWIEAPVATPSDATVSQPATPADALVLGEFERVEEEVVARLLTYGELETMFALSINATNVETFQVETVTGPDGQARGYTLIARRYGHGVGMSQRGAQTMAGSHGMRYDEILGFYYPGMELVNLEWKQTPLVRIEDLPGSLGYARAKPTPKPTPKPLPALTGDEYYANVALATASSSLNVREQPNTGARILGTLDHDQRVIVVRAADDGWFNIKTVEIEGYVKGDYLVKEAP